MIEGAIAEILRGRNLGRDGNGNVCYKVSEGRNG
jgi:hypothetical protein